MRLKYRLTLIVLFSTLICFGQQGFRNPSNWLYQDKYTVKFLKLCDDKTFLYEYNSCTSSYYLSGTYGLKNDTLVLSGLLLMHGWESKKSRSEQLLFRVKRNFISTDILDDKKLVFFQPLSFTTANNMWEVSELITKEKKRTGK